MHLLQQLLHSYKLVQRYDVCKLLGRPSFITHQLPLRELVLFVVFCLEEREIGYFVVEFLFKIVSKYYLGDKCQSPPQM